MYHALVVKNVGAVHHSGSCTGSTKEEVIEAAIALRDKWLACNSLAFRGPYRILVGELTEEVISKPNYELVKF